MSTVASAPPAPESPQSEGHTDTLAEYVRRWWTDVKSGELGSLPIVVGLLIICIRPRPMR
jgi:hypothetical protein